MELTKLLVYGRESTVQKITSALVNQEVEVIGISGDMRAIKMLPAKERVDVALVDARCADAAAACQYISESRGIPMLLVVGQRGNDWENVKSIKADGYLLDSMRNGELMARLNAVLRRATAGLERRAIV